MECSVTPTSLSMVLEIATVETTLLSKAAENRHAITANANHGQTN